ncbi:MAG: polysaccharide deacetylase family protein [Alistipes sp.]
MVITLSFDIEEFDFPLELGRPIDFSRQLEVSTQGLVSILTLLAKYDVHATFYVTANYALNKPEMVREIVTRGHEVASHDYYHSATKNADPVGAKSVLEKITGVPVVGFRAPRLGRMASAELAKAGYKYNASLNPTFIPGRYNNLAKPRTVFCEEGLILYPTSVSCPFRIPLFWISLHVMPFGLYRLLAQSALRKDGHLHLYFHPWEFSSQLKDPSFGVPSYISRCSGEAYLAKLERLIVFLSSKNHRFITTKEYLCPDE